MAARKFPAGKKSILLVKPISDTYYVVSPSLGLGYLAAALLKAGHRVEILDSAKDGLTYERFGEIVSRGSYDIVGFQAFTHELASVKRHSGVVKSLSPSTIVVVGGPHPSGDPHGTMEYLTEVDFGFAGECETALPKFAAFSADELRSEQVLARLPNLIWRSSAGIKVNEIERPCNLDAIGFPAWELLRPDSYPSTPHGTLAKKFPVAPIIVTRGCPYHCTFCAGFTVTGRRLRSRSIESVVAEMELLYRRYGVREFHIEDDNFTFNKELAKGLCREMIKRKMNVSWACPNGVRLDSFDLELLQLMERAGCYSIAVGIESGSDRVLKNMKKSLSKAKIREKIDFIKKHSRLKITGFFILGSPGETEEEILETIRFARELNIDKAGFAFMMPLPGTEVWKQWKASPESREFNYEDFFYYRVVPLSSIPLERLKQLYRKAVWGFYARPKVVLGVLSGIRRWQQVHALWKRFWNIYFGG